MANRVRLSPHTGVPSQPAKGEEYSGGAYTRGGPGLCRRVLLAIRLLRRVSGVDLVGLLSFPRATRALRPRDPRGDEQTRCLGEHATPRRDVGPARLPAWIRCSKGAGADSSEPRLYSQRRSRPGGVCRIISVGLNHGGLAQAGEMRFPRRWRCGSAYGPVGVGSEIQVPLD